MDSGSPLGNPGRCIISPDDRVVYSSSSGPGTICWRHMPKGCSCENLRYDNASHAVIFPSYKKASRGKTTRRVKKKEEIACMHLVWAKLPTEDRGI